MDTAYLEHGESCIERGSLGGNHNPITGLLFEYLLSIAPLLPCRGALGHRAAKHGASVTFQDLNPEVLTQVTMPTVAVRRRHTVCALDGCIVDVARRGHARCNGFPFLCCRTCYGRLATGELP